MYFKSCDLIDKFWTCKHLSKFDFYYGELDKNGRPHQFGILISKNLLYEGSWNQGRFHGKGRMIDNFLGVCNGNWNIGKMQGNGEMMYWNGAKYTGSWSCDKKSGFGILDDKEVHYEGNFMNGMKHGYGEQKYQGKLYYQGNFVNGDFEGKGKFINSKFVYEGDFMKGNPNGTGFMISDSWMYWGDFVNGKRKGVGIYKNSQGAYESKWENNKSIGECIWITSQGLVNAGKWSKNKFIRYIDEIIPNLYLGTVEAALNESLLKQLGIKYILRALDGEKVGLLSGFIYYNLEIKDNEDKNMINHADRAVNFIKRCLEKNKKVLVHCKNGVLRSQAVVIAYLMKIKSMNFEDANNFIQSRIKTNNCFIEQLKSFI